MIIMVKGISNTAPFEAATLSPCANANYAPPGQDGAHTSRLGLAFLCKLAGTG